MTIMYILFSFTVGGTERLVVDLCNQLNYRNNKVFLYIVNNNYDDNILRTLNEKIIIKKDNRQPGKGNKLSCMLHIYKFIKENNIDIVHCNSFNTPELLCVAKILLPKLKIYYTIHGLGQYRTLSKIRVLYRNLLCNSLIAISQSVADDILNYGANKKKINIVYNAIDLNKFNIKSEKKFDSRYPIIGSVARIDLKNKGQDILIKALALVKKVYPNIQCYFAGAADKNHQDDFLYLQELIKERNLENNISFFGNVDNIPGFLERLDLFVLPSRNEGFGISLIEAMTMGLPVISSNLHGPLEVLENGKLGNLFNLRNVTELSELIINVIKNYDYEKWKAEKNKNTIVERYNISKMCDNIINLYKM